MKLLILLITLFQLAIFLSSASTPSHASTTFLHTKSLTPPPSHLASNKNTVHKLSQDPTTTAATATPAADNSTANASTVAAGPTTSAPVDTANAGATSANTTTAATTDASAAGATANAGATTAASTPAPSDVSAATGTNGGANATTPAATTDASASNTTASPTAATTDASASNTTASPAAATTDASASPATPSTTAAPATTTDASTASTTATPAAGATDASAATPPASTTATPAAATTDASGSTATPAATTDASGSTATANATDVNNSNSSTGTPLINGDASNSSNSSNASAGNQSDDDSSSDGAKKPDVYKQGESFVNHSSQQFIDPHGNTFDLVEYVKDLSPYAKEDIRDMNNPLKKDKALVGKPFYFENNITFDESPRIFHEIIETQISKVDTPVTQSSQYGLWKNWLGNKHFQDVSYNDQNRYPLTRPEEQKAEQVADPPSVYYNPNHKVYPPKPNQEFFEQKKLQDLVNVKNPLKRQIYSMGYDNTFVKTDNEVVSELHDIADDVVQDIENYDGNKKKKARRSHYY